MHNGQLKHTLSITPAVILRHNNAMLCKWFHITGSSQHKGSIMQSLVYSLLLTFDRSRRIKLTAIGDTLTLMWHHCNDVPFATCPYFVKWAVWRNGPHTWGLTGCQKQVSRAGTSNYIPQYLWDVITCPCSWHLLLAPKPSYEHY